MHDHERRTLDVTVVDWSAVRISFSEPAMRDGEQVLVSKPGFDIRNWAGENLRGDRGGAFTNRRVDATMSYSDPLARSGVAGCGA